MRPIRSSMNISTVLFVNATTGFSEKLFLVDRVPLLPNNFFQKFHFGIVVYISNNLSSCISSHRFL